MDVLLSQVTKQAMNYAIRTGITITSGYAIQQCGRLMKTVQGQVKEELASLQMRLDSKIRIISPAIDMIELIAARGNTSLESAVTLTQSLRWDIQSLGVRLQKAVGEAKLARKNSSAQDELELKLIISDIKKLLVRIEDAVPLINLAITTSGVSLSTTLPATVSPSRLLQAGTFLNAGDSQYNMTMPRAQQIGPTFTLSMYMLFSGHANRPQDEEGIRNTTWKEIMHKARVTLLRVPLERVYEYPTPFGGDAKQTEKSAHNIPSAGQLHEFAYQLLVLEDLDDGRVHTFEDGEAQPGPYEGVSLAGVREVIPIHEISKIFYADTGKILNIGADVEGNNPILLLKRDLSAEPPRRMMEHTPVEPDYESDDSHTVDGSAEVGSVDEEQSELDDQLRRESTAELPHEAVEDEGDAHLWRLPPNLDLEWMAFEVYTEEPSSDSELDESELDPSSPTEPTPQRTSTESPGLTSYFSKLSFRPPATPPPPNTQLIPSPQKKDAQPASYSSSSPPVIKTSLSLLEMLIRLTALQQFQQTSHLAVPDELLNIFLSDSSTSGAGYDSEQRRRVRRDARDRVGFDPYDESPIKKRGEKYLEHHLYDQHENSEHDGYDPESYPRASLTHSQSYDYDGYPSANSPRSTYSRSRSSTPNPYAPSSPIPPHHNTHSLNYSVRSISSADVPLASRESRNVQRQHLGSASPLLRRATTQPGAGQGQFKGLHQPNFRGFPPAAPPKSSSPRQDGEVGLGVHLEGERGMGTPAE